MGPGTGAREVFVEPSTFPRAFVLDTARPLLRDNYPLRARDRASCELDGGTGCVIANPYLDLAAVCLQQ